MPIGGIVKGKMAGKTRVCKRRGGTEMENGYFNEALSNFTKDFAYGGAIRHLVDKWYTVDRIVKEFNYPLSRESIEKMVEGYRKSKG